MKITYDKKRKDITFCTMLFKMPAQGSFNTLKRMDRGFENFYLPSLKRLIETFGRVALWCDQETADYIKQAGLAKNVSMRVMNMSDLPHWSERDDWLKILHQMKKYRGNLLRRKTPEQWIDYLMMINAKPAILDWAATTNKFKTEYFMWIDAGSLNPNYNGVWNGGGRWGGTIKARPKSRVRISIQPTMGRARPHGVPRFIYDIYRKISGPISDATRETLVRQNMRDIAMINADYDVPACAMIMSGQTAHRFYQRYEHTRIFMKRHGLVSTEQAVFLTMMKFDSGDMFELMYVRGYVGVYGAVADKNPDYIL